MWLALMGQEAWLVPGGPSCSGKSESSAALNADLPSTAQGAALTPTLKSVAFEA